MQTFKTFIEARKNPVQNPKISAYEALLPYSDDESLYISYTDINKIGVNPISTHPQIGVKPKTQYNTPVGIYAYPLRDIWEYYEIGLGKTMKDLPYGAERPYIWLLKLNNSKGIFINDMYTDYTSADYDKDILTLSEIYKTEYISRTRVRFDITDKTPSYESDRERVLSLVDDKWNELVTNALNEAYVKNPVMSFWNISRRLAMYLARINNGFRMGLKWNWILRKCGYSGFADKSGKGYIHPAEPMQAFFLSADAFTVVEKILNKDYKNTEYIGNVNDLNNYITIKGTVYLASLLSALTSQLSVDILPNFNVATGSIKMVWHNGTFDDYKKFFGYAVKWTKHHGDLHGYMYNNCKDLAEAIYYNMTDTQIAQIKAFLDLIAKQFCVS